MTHRNQLLGLLEAYNPTPEEVLTKEQTIAFIQTHIDCFERSCKKGHITASCWLLNFDKTKALLLHHAKMDRLLQPGGHADGDQDALAVAIKEAQEETGIDDIKPVFSSIFDLDIHEIPGMDAHLHFDIRFLLQITKDKQPIQNRESKGFYWVLKNTPLAIQDRSVLRMFEKWHLQSELLP